jgi:predicted dinucleotide-binding enzyme
MVKTDTLAAAERPVGFALSPMKIQRRSGANLGLGRYSCDEEIKMKIGMIGAGAVSLAVARYALAVGHEVVISNRSGPDKLSQAIAKLGKGATAATVAAAARAEVVLLAVPWRSVPEALSGLPDWSGRILVDATNPFKETTPKLVLDDLGNRGASEIVADLAPGARVVKAFNSITMTNFEAGPKRGDARRAVLVSGDDEDAKTKIKQLITSFGFAVIDLGGLKTGGRLQRLY